MKFSQHLAFCSQTELAGMASPGQDGSTFKFSPLVNDLMIDLQIFCNLFKLLAIFLRNMNL